MSTARPKINWADGDPLATAITRITELKDQRDAYLNAFRHRHTNNGKNDTCAKCGLDLRDPIHHGAF